METKDKVEISEEMKLEKEIKEKQEQLHKMRYGEMELAYNELEEAKQVAIEKYNLWRRAALKHGRVPQSLWVYFNRIIS